MTKKLLQTKAPKKVPRKKVTLEVKGTSIKLCQKTRWITLSSNANINGLGLVEPCQALGTSEIVGSMAGRPGRPDTFRDRYPQEKSRSFKTIDEIKAGFSKDASLAFYYPSVPLPERDEAVVEILKHFENSVMLIEKPSHNTAKDA